MKSLFLAGIALAFLVSSAGAENFGSTFGSMTTAQASGRGQTKLTGGVGVGDNATSFLAGVNYGFTDKMDGRVRAGVVDVDGFDSQFAMTGDLRWQVWDSETPTMSGSRMPFDMGLGAFSEWTSGDVSEFGESVSLTVFQLGFQMLGSKSFPMSNGTALAPYGRFNIRYENWSVETSSSLFGSFGVSDSHAAIGLNAGVEWKITPQFDLLGELQIDGNDGFFFGADYNF